MGRSEAGPVRSGALLGRSFVHPVFDYLVIGGGLSLGAAALLVTRPDWLSFGRIELGGESVSSFPWILLLCNSAHLAASSVRLYTKPGATRELPRLTLALPLFALLALTLCVVDAARFGRHLVGLYLTWSPFHYAAQAYGLAVIYALRAGRGLATGEKRLLRQACLLPFFVAMLQTGGAGLGWLLPDAWVHHPRVFPLLQGLQGVLVVLVFAAPLTLFTWMWWRGRHPVPLICPMVVLANGLWWTLFPYENAFAWATVFHGLQYLGIATVFHVKDQVGRAGNARGPLFHVLQFYALSVALGYAVLYCLPRAYVFAGFGMVESVLLVIAAINIHHFIVDAYIWRVSRGGANRSIVQSGVVQAVAAG
jgi:hypothetical protein